MRSNIKLTPGINFLDSYFDDDVGLCFTAVDGAHSTEVRITVYDRAGGLMDSIPLADIDPDKSIEEVANDWLDEHRGKQ